MEDVEMTDTSKPSYSEPTLVDEVFYKMDHPNRGIAVIFNHKHFHMTGVNDRRGTGIDTANLEITFKKLKFDVHIFEDPTYDEIIDVVNNVVAADHTAHDCFVMVILSHGEENGCLLAKDKRYKLNDILEQFSELTCPTLSEKPKLFFVQACQGNLMDSGIILTNDPSTATSSTSDMVHIMQPINIRFPIIPIIPDLLVAFSAVPGHFSWRHTDSGSYFIQALCDMLFHHSKEYHLMELLTFAAKKVAFDFQSYCPSIPEMHMKKQCPCIMSHLTRILLFN